MTRSARRPNILLLMLDQLSPQSLGCYGHPLVETPHLTDLARRGVVFENAYCNSPLCAPSRFSMMAGQRVSRIGAWDNAVEFPSSVPTFAHYLRTAGYRTCLSGKMHFVGAGGILKLLLRLQKELNVSYLYITHDLATVKAIADWIVVMHQGRIVQQGPKQSVLTPPHHAYTELLLSSVPEMDPAWLDGVLARRATAAGGSAAAASAAS